MITLNGTTCYQKKAYRDDIKLMAEYPDTDEGREQAIDDAWDLKDFDNWEVKKGGIKWN